MGNNILQIHRGDTFPRDFLISRKGEDWMVGGIVVEMSFEFDDAIVHTFTGTQLGSGVYDATADITDYTFQFEPTLASVASIRCGKFDIQVDDGSYIATHLAGTVDIVFDVTP